jgi:hypothetical protein
VRVAFPTEKNAQIACATLSVDQELQSTKITRTITTEGSAMVA